MRLADIATLGGRWMVLDCVVLLPFLRFLLRNGYPILRAESVAASIVLAVVCLALALLARQRMVFLALAAIASVLMATVPVVRMLAPWAELSPRSAAAILGALLAAAILLMREKSAVILAVFTLSAFGVDLAQAVAVHFSHQPVATIAAANPAPHTLYIVLDEHLGAAGFPAGIAACADARSTLEHTLAAARFRHFTHAYSNYPSTVSSLSSLLNRRLLDRRRMFLNENSPQWRWGTRTLQENRLVAEFKRRGYRVEIFQHRAINHAAPGISVDRIHEYWDRLGQLEQSPGPWFTRFRWLVGNYQQSDLVLSQVKAFFPFRFAPHTTGPLAAAAIWPAELEQSILQAPTRTLFFVHLMAPHFPYLYKKDGTVRNLDEWTGDRVDQRSGDLMYRDRYQRYCEQVQFVSAQLQGLFGRLQAAGAYSPMTIVIHGDHGSRIRKAFDAGSSTRAAGSDPESFDYAGAPSLRDLLDRFSALFAFKAPGAAEASVDPEPTSLLNLLARTLPLGDPPAPGADSVYLFDAQGHPEPIDLRQIWRNTEGTR
ncbi:MAG: sulfatase-like hydrolase/transferase [Bryobacteraceae bacterium]